MKRSYHLTIRLFKWDDHLLQGHSTWTQAVQPTPSPSTNGPGMHTVKQDSLYRKILRGNPKDVPG